LSKKSFAHTRIQAIKVALEGIKYVITTQPNARIHVGFTLAVFLVAGLLKLPRLEWVILLLTVGLVWAAEVFNTAVEISVDVVSPNYDPKAKIIKDISAGAVLISVFVSILVGLFIFGPYLWIWIKTFF
jgi:diacylglycerol kinase